VTGAHITLATNAVSGWNEIDAVQMVGEQAQAFRPPAALRFEPVAAPRPRPDRSRAAAPSPHAAGGG
jgi:hypothetical protein